jgi:choline kinase
VTAIILAAGVGKRLLGVSGGRPKCLIELGGRSLLARQLEALRAAGVHDAVVVVGFGEAHVRDAVAGGPAGMRVRCISNPRYREGAILSLWAARAALTGPVLVMDADVLCSRAMVARLVGSPHANCFLLDGSAPSTGEEQMLLVRDGLVRNIVRGGAPGYDEQGESVGFLKLSGDASRLLAGLLARRVEAGDTGIEHEDVYPELLAAVEVGFERVDGLAWTEIDFPEDVVRAEREILPLLQAAGE